MNSFPPNLGGAGFLLWKFKLNFNLRTWAGGKGKPLWVVPIRRK